MKNFKHTWLALFAVLAVGTASAQSMKEDSGYYGEVGYTPISISHKSLTLKPKLVRLTAGKDINENLSIEGMYATTVSKDKQYDVEISASNYGVFLKPKLEIATDTEVFARVGVVASKVEGMRSGVSASETGVDASYGLGIATKLTKDIYAQVDYMSYYDRNGTTAKAFAVSVGKRF